MSPPGYPSAWLHPCRARLRFTWHSHCNSRWGSLYRRFAFVSRYRERKKVVNAYHEYHLAERQGNREVARNPMATTATTNAAATSLDSIWTPQRDSLGVQ